MGITPLTPLLVKHIITTQELPARAQTFSLRDATAIFRYGAVVGSIIEHHRQLDRGMDLARRLIEEHEGRGKSFASGTVILADQLHDGQGRFHRPWHAPAGGVWMTLVLVNTLLPETSRLLPLAAGVAVCELLTAHGLPASLKWVNDVLVDGRKISGTLVETLRGSRSGEEYILIGTGINVNNTEFPPELQETAISLKGSLSVEADTTMLAAGLLAKLAWNIGLLHFVEQQRMHGEDQDPVHPLIGRWREFTDMTGRLVLFGHDVQKNPLFEARVMGIADDGSLLLKLPDGHIVSEVSGELIYLD